MLTTCIFKKRLNVHDIIVAHEDFKLFVYIDLNLLHPNQLDLDINVVNRKLKNPKMNSTPYVVLLNGDLILIDGHHTIASKILKGIKKAKCLFYPISKN